MNSVAPSPFRRRRPVDRAYRAFVAHVAEGRTITDRDYPRWADENLSRHRLAELEADALPEDEREPRLTLIYQAAASAPFRIQRKESKAPPRVADARARSAYAELNTAVDAELKRRGR